MYIPSLHFDFTKESYTPDLHFDFTDNAVSTYDIGTPNNLFAFTTYLRCACL